MKKRLKLPAAILAVIASSSYANDNCFDYEKSLPDMFKCFQNRLDTQRLQLNTQQAQIGKLAAENQNQQKRLDTQQKRITFLTKENQRLQKLAILPERYENVRAFVAKGTVDKICPKGTKAAHVPLSFRGKTGNEICAANDRDEKSCQSVIYRYVTNSNGHGPYPKYDQSCQQPVDNPWPWGNQRKNPNTYSPEWGFGSIRIVCCKR